MRVFVFYFFIFNALNGNFYGSQLEKFSFKGPVLPLMFSDECAVITTVLVQPVLVFDTLPTPLMGV